MIIEDINTLGNRENEANSERLKLIMTQTRLSSPSDCQLLRNPFNPDIHYTIERSQDSLLLFEYSANGRNFLRKFPFFNKIYKFQLFLDKQKPYLIVFFKDRNVCLFTIDFDLFLLEPVCLINFQMKSALKGVNSHKLFFQRTSLIEDPESSGKLFCINENNEFLYLFGTRNMPRLAWLFTPTVKGEGVLEHSKNTQQMLPMLFDHTVKLNLSKLVNYPVSDVNVWYKSGEVFLTVFSKQGLSTLSANDAKIDTFTINLQTYKLCAEGVMNILSHKQDTLPQKLTFNNSLQVLELCKADIRRIYVIDSFNEAYLLDCGTYAITLNEQAFSVLAFHNETYNLLTHKYGMENILRFDVCPSGPLPLEIDQKPDKMIIRVNGFSFVLFMSKANWVLYNMRDRVDILDCLIDKNRVLFCYEGENRLNEYFMSQGFTTHHNFIAHINEITLSNTEQAYQIENGKVNKIFELKDYVVVSKQNSISAVCKNDFMHLETTKVGVNVKKAWRASSNSFLIKSTDDKLRVFNLALKQLKYNKNLHILEKEKILFGECWLTDTTAFVVLTANAIYIFNNYDFELRIKTELNFTIKNVSRLGDRLVLTSNDGKIVEALFDNETGFICRNIELQLDSCVKFMQFQDKYYNLTAELDLQVYNQNCELIRTFHFKNFYHTVIADRRTQVMDFSVMSYRNVSKFPQGDLQKQITDLQLIRFDKAIYLFFLTNSAELLIYKFIDLNKVILLFKNEFHFNSNASEFKLEITPLHDKLLLNIENEKSWIFQNCYNVETLRSFSNDSINSLFTDNTSVTVFVRGNVKLYKKTVSLTKLAFNETIADMLYVPNRNHPLFIVLLKSLNSQELRVISFENKVLWSMMTGNDRINYIKLLEQPSTDQVFYILLGYQVSRGSPDSFTSKWKILYFQLGEGGVIANTILEQSFQETNQSIKGAVETEDIISILTDNKILQIKESKITKVIDTEFDGLSCYCTFDRALLLVDKHNCISFYYFDETTKDFSLKLSFNVENAVKDVRFIKNLEVTDYYVFTVLTTNNKLHFYRLGRRNLFSEVFFAKEKIFAIDFSTETRFINSFCEGPCLSLLSEESLIIKFWSFDENIFKVLEKIYDYMSSHTSFMGGLNPRYQFFGNKREIFGNEKVCILDYEVIERYMNSQESLVRTIKEEINIDFEKVFNRVRSIQMSMADNK